MKHVILGTGLSGLIGSRLVELLSPEYDFENLSLETGVNILDVNDLDQRFGKSQAEWVLHLAAKTDVDGCEKDRNLGEIGDAWKINVGGTQNIVAVCQKYHKKIIYISTDFVFDGIEKKYYTEEDIPNPKSWYAQTKYEGEKIVQNSTIPYLICRIAYPYKTVNENKKDLVHLLLDKLQKNEKITAINDQHITPTFIDDICMALKILIQKDLHGIYHIVGSPDITPYEMAVKIARAFSLDENLVSKTTLTKYYKNRAPRPFHAVLKNAKIENLGIKMHSLDEGLEIIKEQQINYNI